MKLSRISQTALILFAIVVGVAFAGPSKSLTGSYIIGGKTLVDPPANEPKDTHLQIFLTGDSAKDLYQSMRVKPVADQCLLDGSVTKFLGGTACTMHVGGKAYECSFSVNIRSQRIESAYVC